MRDVRIYALRDPENGDVRYVGMTVHRIETRRDRHVREAYYSNRWHHHKNCWIRSLSASPVVTLLEITSEDAAGMVEQRWIAYFRAHNVDLTNLTDGGSGTLGVSPSQATIEKRRAKLIGRPRSEAVKLAISIKNSGKKRTPEARQKMSNAKKGKPWSPAQREAYERRRNQLKWS